MNAWQIDLMALLDEDLDPDALFARVVHAARGMGFEHCAYGMLAQTASGRPQAYTTNNYPDDWQRRYASAGYLNQDPTVAHGKRSQSLLVWDQRLFNLAPAFWAEAQSFGLRHGLAQSSFTGAAAVGMLSLSRPHEAISSTELATLASRVRWLSNLAHIAISGRVLPTLAEVEVDLTGRELEVLKWTSDGKTAADIATILGITKDTVNFHVKNVVAKLRATNKTAAVVRASRLGLLN